MMKKILYALCCFFISNFAFAQENADNIPITSLWDTMPDSLCPLKSEAKIDTTVSNDKFLSVVLSKASTVQIALLKDNNGGNIICMIKTFSAPVGESYISFYDLNWNNIGTQLFDFSTFSPDTSLQKYFDPTLISAKLSNDCSSIIITLSTSNITEEDKKLIIFPLTKTLGWNGVKFQ